MRRVGWIGTGLVILGFLAIPQQSFGNTQSVQCPTGTVNLAIDSTSESQLFLDMWTERALYLVAAKGRVINNTTATVTWTGKMPVGKIDGTHDMSQVGAGTKPPVASKATKSFWLRGYLAVNLSDTPSHIAAAGITHLKWADSKYGSCPTPSGSIVQRAFSTGASAR